MSTKRYRLYSALLAVGASVVLARTIVMLSRGARVFLAPWVFGLLLAEMMLDAGALASALRWWTTGTGRNERLSLRLALAVTLLHAVRVLVFVMGRTGPWENFDVRPDQRTLHQERWSRNDVYFAGIPSAVSIAAVVLIWRLRKRRLRPERAGTSTTPTEDPRVESRIGESMPDAFSTALQPGARTACQRAMNL